MEERNATIFLMKDYCFF